MSTRESNYDSEIEYPVMWTVQDVRFLFPGALSSVATFTKVSAEICAELKAIYDEHGDDWTSIEAPGWEFETKTGQTFREGGGLVIIPGAGTRALAEAKSLGCSWATTIKHPLSRLAEMRESRKKLRDEI